MAMSERACLSVLFGALAVVVALLSWAVLGPTERPRCYGETPLTRVEIPCGPGSGLEP